MNKAYDSIKEFMLQSAKLYIDGDYSKIDALEPVKFEVVMANDYPLVWKFIGETRMTSDWSNWIDIGTEGDIEDNLRIKGNYLYYHAEVWHFADWDNLTDYIVKEFGAEACDWVSDEYINPFDCIDV